MTEEHDLDAAERALGTMAVGRETPGQAHARAAWEARLAPLAEFFDPVDPPADLFDQIEAQLDHDALIFLAERRAARWRSVAVGAMAASVALAAWIAFQSMPDPAPRYIAAMTADGAQTVLVDVSSGTATVWPVPSAAARQGAFEVWHLVEGNAPVSLGLARTDAHVRLAVAAAPGDAIAISLEPPGGSPTGQPTGAVLFSGILHSRE